jgi:septum formation protein
VKGCGLILASASPQRRAILEQVGIAFDVRVSGVEEETHGDPVAVAEENARRKALATASAVIREANTGGAAASPRSTLTLGADTLVAVDGDILGKPRDAGQAREYVARLAGRTHQVVGAIALVREGERTDIAVEITQVHFRPASPAQLDWYVATGEWQGRAGGYAIQGVGAALVSGIEGDYLNVVGLPLARLLDLEPSLWPIRGSDPLRSSGRNRAQQ